MIFREHRSLLSKSRDLDAVCLEWEAKNLHLEHIPKQWWGCWLEDTLQRRPPSNVLFLNLSHPWGDLRRFNSS